MKKLLSIIVLTTLNFGRIYSQNPTEPPLLPFDKTTNKITYTEVIEVDGQSKPVLFSKSVEWVALNYKSANDVVQLKDESMGKIIVKGVITTQIGTMILADPYTPLYMNHTLIIDVKDGKVRLTLTDFTYDYTVPTHPRSEGTLESTYPKPNVINKRSWYGMFQDFDNKTKSLISTYRKHITTHSTSTNDW